MNHVVFLDREALIYDDVAETAQNIDLEFTHATVQYLTQDIKRHGWLRTKVREVYCNVMFKLGKPRPEFFCERVINDLRSGNRYRIIVEIVPGGAIG